MHSPLAPDMNLTNPPVGATARPWHRRLVRQFAQGAGVELQGYRRPETAGAVLLAMALVSAVVGVLSIVAKELLP